MQDPKKNYLKNTDLCPYRKGAVTHNMLGQYVFRRGGICSSSCFFPIWHSCAIRRDGEANCWEQNPALQRPISLLSANRDAAPRHRWGISWFWAPQALLVQVPSKFPTAECRGGCVVTQGPFSIHYQHPSTLHQASPWILQHSCVVFLSKNKIIRWLQ